jgi:glycolate oxidase FAD binding subunit
MNGLLEPATAAELAEAVRSAPRVIARGGGTKPRLSAAAGATPISLRRLTGVVEYAPTEFTFTARAGTPLCDIIGELAEQGQYLPWDPPFAAAGASLGGAVGAGFNGPGRLRFGGLRDFILGVQFVDGEGRLLRMGGKVVKNAAGFDLPKFLAGSLGRFGVLAEITFKVFPRPPASATVEFSVPSEDKLAPLVAALAKGRWEVDAVEIPVGAGRVYARVCGPVGAVPALAADLGRQGPSRVMAEAEADLVWTGAAAFSWAHAQGVLCKVPLALPAVSVFAAMVREIDGARAWIGAAGNVGYLSLPAGAELAPLNARFRQLGWAGLVWRGESELWLGSSPDFQIHARIKRALDPNNRFPPLL